MRRGLRWLWQGLSLVVVLSTLVACGMEVRPVPVSSPTPAPEEYTLHLPGVEAGGEGPSTPTVTSPLSPVPTPVPSPTPLPPAVFKPEAGVQVHLFAGEPRETLRWAEGVGVEWIKQQVEWHTIEQAPGQFNWVLLDQAVNLSEEFGFNLLLSVVHAPDHLRTPGEIESGPPLDYGEFRRFMQQLAERYQGRVEAYELWNEPNLQREWRGEELDPARFVAFVAEGAQGVRAGDPQALVISGGPAVTGINDGVTAIDDRIYMRGMLEAGVAQWVDGIGVHPYGFANPPEESVHDAQHVAPSHNDHPSFFFRDTLETYRRLLLEYGAGDVELWVTEFGWASAEGMGAIDRAGVGYMYDVSEQQQAAYTVRAFEMGLGTEWVGPMFLWNLNIAPIWGGDRAVSAYSLLRPDKSYRPAYIALRLTGPPHEAGTQEDLAEPGD